MPQQNILEYVAGAGINTTAVYIDKLTEVFTHAKSEVIGLNQKLDTEILNLSIR